MRQAGVWGERRYSSYSFSTSALDGGEWSASHPSRALPPGKGLPVPIVQEAGWASRAGLDKNWTKITQYIIKYKQKYERAVKKSDERDEMRESDGR
jgi:hypothetical protein